MQSYDFMQMEIFNIDLQHCIESLCVQIFKYINNSQADRHKGTKAHVF